MNKLTGYQRIEALCDSGTFEEIGTRGDSAVTGTAKINRKQVYIVAIDTAVMRGSLGKISGDKINHILDMAVKYKYPVITLFESVGARVQEGIFSMHYLGTTFRKFSEVSGIVPTIAVLFGVNSGATAYTSALMDFVIMVENSSYAFITGPKVVDEMTGEKISMEELGGTSVHGSLTGLATFVEQNEYLAIVRVKQLLSYLPQHCFEIAQNFNPQKKKRETHPELVSMIPQDNKKEGYDMTSIIKEIADDDSFMELYDRFAPNLIVAFVKLGDVTIGIAANQPLCLSGILDVDSCRKLFRFIQLCDAYNIPMLFIADSPGFMPGKEQEQASILAAGARVLHVLSNTTIPKITLIVNKIIGGAYGGMSSASLGADMVVAWPTAQISVLGAKAAMSVIYNKEIDRSHDKVSAIEKKTREFEDKHLTPYPAAEHGQVDAVIDPQDTRKILLRSFIMLQNKVDTGLKKRRNILPM